VVALWSQKNSNKDFSVMVFQQKNRGAPSARNKGIEKARGVYLQFLDSDDTLEPEKFANQVAALEKSVADVAVCDFRYEYSDPEKSYAAINDGELHEKLVTGWSIYTSSPLIRHEIVKKGVRWDEKLKRQQDMDFILKIMILAPRYIYTPGVWCNYIQHSGKQISDEYQKKAPQFFQRIISLISFVCTFRRELPWERKSMAIKSVIFIAIRMARFWIGKVLIKILGDQFLKYIKRYI
jgi:glycosyltransferase involved in cell wall biosynthesis